jgi:roadblock/LC7 domain-containing protein
LFLESPSALEMAHWFCAAVSMMFNSLASAAGGMTRSALIRPAGCPPGGWAFSGGDYTIAVHGDRFVIGESAKVGSFDELRRLLQEGISG